MDSQALLGSVVLFAAVVVACFALAPTAVRWYEGRRERAAKVQADLRLKSPVPLTVWGGTALCALALAGGLWAGMPVLGLVGAFLLSRGVAFLPEHLRRKRTAAFEEQLPDAMTAVANSLRAGLALPQALAQAARESKAPMSEELQRIVDEYDHGTPLGQAFENARLRIRHREFDLCVAAFRVGEKQGGDTTKVFDQISSAVREIRRLEEKIRTATTQGRSSARFMSLMPAVFLLLLYVMDAESANLLFTTTIGTVVLSIVILFNFVGHLWIRRLLAVEV
jgi:tight adherence protein B